MPGSKVILPKAPEDESIFVIDDLRNVALDSHQFFGYHTLP